MELFLLGIETKSYVCPGEVLVFIIRSGNNKENNPASRLGKVGTGKRNCRIR